jgi:1,4-alpha-glucan branching enzyme
MENGYLALVLNAHMPFVRRPEYPRFLEERWLFEAISETYLPLLRMFRSLEADGVSFHLSLSISPTLASMLSDKILGDKYIAYLDAQLALAAAEEERIGGDPAFGPLARMYKNLYRADKDDFVELYGRDILAAFDYYYKKGRVELLTSAATHAFLPLFRDSPESIVAQVETAIVTHRNAFGKHPAGFWLPQLGWYPGVAEVLRAYNVQYTVVTTKGAIFGDPTPERGSFAPVECPAGLLAFVRDAEAANAVLSESSGYPSDPVYRDFYRDIGFDLPANYLQGHLEGSEERIFTGFKYWAVTGRTNNKVPYNPLSAQAKAAQHAAQFLADRSKEAENAAKLMDRPPLMVCPFDAELFGHWWFEGPAFLEALFRLTASSSGLGMITLGDYARCYPQNQISTPEFSSWGDGGFAEVWLDGSNDWIYRHISKAIERMSELAERFPDESGLRERILNQAAREVLISMCSDWALLMRSGKSSAFGRKQIEEAISNFSRIYDMLCSNTVSTEWLTKLEKRDNLFPDINYRMYRKKR